ncbi:class I SAM-dependent methyltransferase [Pedobacter sp. MR2016-24]|uniref:class I SAM-dependent methyltransferase n=1 Tax=Pedobacter sp. MR2016-24 TaxID=2994466 RepID=UPI0022456460|nr:class I SAM-dependent methyltransferase [Pedobacter sp. MR2016-24]MCX2485558.1 class I SAM-dependent methyltransferase [Pedobacter sp. MR2016-24]
MPNNYDPIASVYDTLSRMVFFRSQVKAQLHQLHYLSAGQRILIVGGGTGWILEEISKVHRTGLTITYVEVSAKMLELSKKRNTANHAVTFIHSPIEEFSIGGMYDVVITAFLFDNFMEKKVVQVFHQLHTQLNSKGFWLFTDFYYTKRSGRIWQLYLLKLMYWFFRQVSDVEAKALIHTEGYFVDKGYRVLQEQYYYGKFIQSIVYQKP